MKRILLALIAILSQTGCALFSNKPETTTTIVTPDTAVTPTMREERWYADLFDLKELHQDVNADEIIDSVFLGWSGGSLTGGDYLYMEDGKTKKPYNETNEDYLEAVVKICTIEVKESAYAAIAEKVLLPTERRSELEPVAQWVVSSLKQRKVIDNDIFYSVSKPKLLWQSSLNTPKESYCVKVSAKMAEEVSKYRLGCHDADFIGGGNYKDSAWLVVPDRIFQNELTQIFQFNNTIVFSNGYCIGIERNNLFAWVFVNDCFLTGRSSRSAIDSIKVSGGLIWVEASLTNFVIDVNTGKVALLQKFIDFEHSIILQEFHKL